MDARQERGLAIARSKASIRRQHDHKWLVPAQSINGFYTVNPIAGSCSCPDHETRGVKCKHQWAVEYVRYRVRRPDGTIEETTIARVTYTQNWPAYNRAQTTEKEHVGSMLHALCDGIVQPPQGRGRPRLALADVTHAAVMKVYSGMSGRRASTDIRENEARGLIGRAPHYNSVHGFIERSDVTGLLSTLVEESAAPLKAVESQFAVDSTGFSTSVYARWFDHRYGREMKEQTYIKAHAMVGAKTNVVASVEVTDSNMNDSPQLPGLVASTARRFAISEVSADKAYLGSKNLDAIEAVGAVPYIPFKSNSRGEGPAAWRRMWHLFSFKREEFLTHYHQRSNVETTFSAIKRLFGGSVRAKLPVAQKNEVLLKCIAYNLTCLVHAIYELDLTPTFWADSAPAQLIGAS